MKNICFTICSIFIFFLGFIAERDYDISERIYGFFYKPVISVVMSTFNREQVLPIAIESILNQTFKDFEFIIIDDGSTDNTWKVIQSYARKDKRIVPLKNEKNKGLIYSLNRGLDQARGKYIARMDDDDKSVLYRFERQVWAMEENPDIVVLGAKITPSQDPLTKPTTPPLLTSPDEIALNTYFTSGVKHPTVMMRRDFLNKHHLRYDPKYLYAEDSGLWKDILNKGGKISSLNETLVYFRYSKNVSHPPRYLQIQNETYKHIQQEKFTPFWKDIPYEWLSMQISNEHKCIILKKMIESNKKLKILNQKVLEKQHLAICEKETLKKNGILVIHPQWSDYLYINDDHKTFFRIDYPDDTGRIVLENNNTVTVQWDNWGVEVYKKEDNGKKWILIEN